MDEYLDALFRSYFRQKPTKKNGPPKAISQRAWTSNLGLDRETIKDIILTYDHVFPMHWHLFAILYYLTCYPTFDQMAVTFSMSSSHLERIVLQTLITFSRAIDEVMLFPFKFMRYRYILRIGC